MYTNTSFQNIKIVEARVHADLASVPFTIKFRGGDGSWGEVCFHLENAPLAIALVKAINETLAAFAPAPSPPEQQNSDDDLPF